MRLADFVSSLEFQQNSALDEQVTPEAPNVVASKPDRDGKFTINLHSVLLKCKSQSPLVNGFKKSVTKLVVNLIENANYAIS
jgi:hypothetical protein